MSMLLAIALFVVGIGVFGAFMKGVFVLLPTSLQRQISHVSNIMDEVIKLLILFILPFVGWQAGAWNSVVWAVMGALIGLVAAIGIRQSILEAQTERNILKSAMEKTETPPSSSKEKSTSPNLKNCDTMNVTDADDGETEYKAAKSLPWAMSKELDKARNLLISAIEKKPQAKYYDLLGTIYRLSGMPNEAMNSFTKAIELSPDKEGISNFYYQRAQSKQLNFRHPALILASP